MENIGDDFMGMSIDDIKKSMTPNEYLSFNNWIYGQTCPVLHNGKPGYYKHDVERFLRLIRKGEKTYFD